MTGVRTVALGLALALGACGSASGGQAAKQPPRPRGIVLLVPGTGFNGTRADSASRMSIREVTWQQWGFRTRVADYRRGRDGLTDVERAIRGAARSDPDLPLCLYGESSGGTWALVAAARSRSVACLVIAASPTDQETLARSPLRLARHLGADVWPRYFGPAEGDNALEPYDIWLADEPEVPVWMVYAANDPVVPPQQGRLFAPLGAATELTVLRAGVHNFVHSKVDPLEFVRARNAIHAFVDSFAF